MDVISPAQFEDNLPKLVKVEQVSNGWIKKYILTYEKPNGSLYTYESASRKPLEAYQDELLSNAQSSSNRHNQNKSQAALASTLETRIKNCDAVCIVPELPDGSYLMIKEFRYPVNGVFAAFPAGLIDEGEDISTTVDRELREETGYCLRRDVDQPIRTLAQPGFSSVGMTDENVLVVFAKVEKAGDAHPESNEFIEPFILPGDSIRDFLDTTTYFLGTRVQLLLELLAAQNS